MLKQLDVKREDGKAMRGGVMVVPTIMDPAAWQKLAMAHQLKLLLEAKQ